MMEGCDTRTRRAPAAPLMWMRIVSALAVFLLALPTFADDNARANRLMVEAVGLVGAAEREPSAQERFRLLQRANELLLDIVQRHPSTDLAVKLATGQRIGTVSLAGVREAMDKARDAVAAAPPPPGQPGAPVQAWLHRKAVVAVGLVRDRRAGDIGEPGRRRGDPRHRHRSHVAQVAARRSRDRRRPVP